MKYVELHAHSNFSFLDGVSQVETLVERAAEIGLPALALTDHDNLSGAARFSQAARANNLRPIFGAELTLADGFHLLLLVKDKIGWRNLCTLITQAQHAAPKGQAKLPLNAFKGHTEGLIALSGGRSGAITSALLRGDRRAAKTAVRQYITLFGKENFWIELHHHRLHDDRSLIYELVLLARQLGVGYVAANNVHYASAEGHGLQEVVTAIKHKTTLDESRHIRRPSHEYYLKSAEDMAELFSDYPEAITNTLKIAEQCQFDLTRGIQEFPTCPTPGGIPAIKYIRRLCLEAISKRYPNASPEDRKEIYKRLDHELAVIERTGSADYFLLVWDICRFAREQGIRYQGRGSGAGSMTAFLLYISNVDPLQFNNLLFERFLSVERGIAGDFDIDFESGRRPEIIQYIFGKYGIEHAAMASTYVSYRAKSAVRDVAKTFGIPHDAIPHLREALDLFDTNLRNHFSLTDKDGGITLKYLIDYAGQLTGFPRHLGQHNGGFVITKAPIRHFIPTEPTRDDDRFVVQWDKDSLEDLGWLKVDVLGLKMLDVISAALRLIERTTGKKIDLDKLRYDDPRVYRMVTLADTVGVFQLDSRAQSQNLPFLRPSKLLDLLRAISLIRPGPIQAGTVHAFFRRLLKQEPVMYLHPSLEPVLKDSLGVLLWQEQVALVAQALAGFSLGEGEQMRRAIAKGYAQSEIDRWEAKFIAGASERGVSEDIARKVFEQIKAFGGYAFLQAHAAAFAVLVYQSAYLRCYYPVEYGAALLNNMQVGFWSPSVVVNDLRRRGIEILPVNVNKSQAECTIENGAIRMGFSYVAALGETGADKIVTARGDKPFTSLVDFYRRTRLPESQIENLILCGAMSEWKQPIPELIWQLGTVGAQVNELGLVFEEEYVDFPPLTRAEKFKAEVSVLGLSTRDHVLALYRDQLNARGILTSQQLKKCKNGQRVRIAGMTAVLQRPPTAKGHAFLTTQDEYFDFMDAIIRPKIFEAHRRIIRNPLLVVEGTVQRRGNVINVLVDRLYDLQHINQAA